MAKGVVGNVETENKSGAYTFHFRGVVSTAVNKSASAFGKSDWSYGCQYIYWLYEGFSMSHHLKPAPYQIHNCTWFGWILSCKTGHEQIQLQTKMQIEFKLCKGLF